MTTPTTTHKADDHVVCPHCGKTSEDVAADWVIPGFTDEQSRARDQCEHCGGDIDVEFNGFGYLVSGP